MNLFVKQIIFSIENLIGMAKAKGDDQLLFMMPTFSELDTYELLEEFNNLSNRYEDIDFTVKISRTMWNQWQDEARRERVEDELDMVAVGDKLTSYRNMISTSEKMQVIILCGVDKQTDKASLEDFYRFSSHTIWERDMKKSFRVWLEWLLTDRQMDRDLINEIVGYNSLKEEYTSSRRLDLLLSMQTALGLDIARMSKWLSQLNTDGIENVKEFDNALYDHMSHPILNISSLRGCNNKLSFTGYLKKEREFYNGEFSTDGNINGVLDKLDRLKKDIEEGQDIMIDVNGFIPPDYPITNVIDDIKSVISDSASDNTIAKLKQIPFPTILDGILKFKQPRKGTNKPRTQKTIRVYGHPVEAVFSAVWKSLSEVFKSDLEFKNTPGELRDKFGGFKVRLKEYQCAGDPKGKGKLSEDLICLIGGLDDVFKQYEPPGLIYDCNLTADSEDEDLVNKINVKTIQIPKLFFNVQLLSRDGKLWKDEFVFVLHLSKVEDFQLMTDMIISLRERGLLDADHEEGLPCFHIDYFDNMMHSGCKEDFLSTLHYSIGSIRKTDLLSDRDWTSQVDPEQLNKLMVLAKKYREFLLSLAENGISYAGMLNNDTFSDNLLEIMRSDALRERKVQTQYLLNILLRAFLIVKDRDENNSDWHGLAPEQGAIVSLLHPCVLDQLQQRYLFISEAFTYLLNHSPKFSADALDCYFELSAIQHPLPGLLVNQNQIITNFKGNGLFHRIGTSESPKDASGVSLSESLDGDTLSESILMKEGAESKFILRVLVDYLKTHVHIWDGIKITCYHTDNIQPLIAAVNQFLILIHNGKKPLLEDNGIPDPGYTVDISFITQSNTCGEIEHWVKEWQLFWENSDKQKYSFYQNCRFNLNHCVIPTCDNKEFYIYDELPEVIKELDESDILFLFNFIPHNTSGSTPVLMARNIFNQDDHGLKFPIMERAFINDVNNKNSQFLRERMVGNNKFRLFGAYAGILYNAKEFFRNELVIENVLESNLWSASQHNVEIIERSDFNGWKEHFEPLYYKTDWLVCVDKSIDEKMLHKFDDYSEVEQKIIGFGTGIGEKGTHNYTISSCRQTTNDLQEAIKRRMECLFKESGASVHNDVIAPVVSLLAEEANKFSGLSSIRAANQISASNDNDYSVNDYISYAACHFLMVDEPSILRQNEWKFMVSLDAYSHWFDDADDIGINISKDYPDLLLVHAILEEKQTQNQELLEYVIKLNVSIIECKMSTNSGSNLLNHAEIQVINGLHKLTKYFEPTGGEDELLRARYWRLQLHRLLSSHINFNSNSDDSLSKKINLAMNNLCNGNFEINWDASILFYKNDVRDERITLHRCSYDSNIPVYQIGTGYLLKALGSDAERITWIQHLKKNGIVDAPRIDLSNIINTALVSSNEDDTDDTDQEEIDDGTPAEQKDHPNNFKRNADEPYGNPKVRENEESPSYLNGTSSHTDNEPEEPDEVTNEEATVEAPLLSDVRILLGHTTDRFKRPIHWEYGNKSLNNRHLAIFGKSGVGKTYAVQAILCELGQCVINSLVVDYSSSFTKEKLHPITLKTIQPSSIDVLTEPLPIQPFKCDLSQSFDLEDAAMDMGERMSEVFGFYYNMGDQQSGYLGELIEQGIIKTNNKYDTKSLLSDLETMIEETESSATRKSIDALRRKVRPFLRKKYFSDENMNWSDFMSPTGSLCKVIQASSIDSKSNQNCLTEFILRDIIGSSIKEKWDSDTPRTIVLDEVQNLNHKEGKPISIILREGRKFGINGIFATQNISGINEGLVNMEQCAQSLYFEPSASEIDLFAKTLNTIDSKVTVSEWKKTLAGLGRGECISVGLHDDGNGNFKKRAVKIKIESLENRFGDSE